MPKNGINKLHHTNVNLLDIIMDQADLHELVLHNLKPDMELVVLAINEVILGQSMASIYLQILGSHIETLAEVMKLRNTR